MRLHNIKNTKMRHTVSKCSVCGCTNITYICFHKNGRMSLGRQVCQTQCPCWQAIHRLGRDALRKIARFFVFLGVINCCNKIEISLKPKGE